MGLGCGMQLIKRFGRSGYGSIKTKSQVGRTKVIINGLGNSDHRHAHFGKTVGNLKAAVPANRNMTGKFRSETSRM
jgi:hypothetical protein